jgi:hypothetical protein
LANDVHDSKEVANANVDPDAKEMAAFWSSVEAFLASASSESTTTVTTEDTGAGEGEDSFAQLWGKGWIMETADAGSFAVDLFTQTDDVLRAEDILHQDIFT